jgi:hypothetical protein
MTFEISEGADEMAEREQPHLRIRIDPDLLARIDDECERSGRTRTDEIERRLLESFLKTDLQMVAEMAVHNVLVRVQQLEESLAKAKGREPTDFYQGLFKQARKEVRKSK